MTPPKSSMPTSSRRARLAAVLLAGLLPLTAAADVYQEQGAKAMGGLMGLLSSATQPGKDRYLVMNGTVLTARLGSTSLTPDALADKLAAAYDRAAQATVLPEPVSVEEQFQLARSRALRRPFMHKAGDWAAFGRFFGGDVTDLASVPELSLSGKLGEDGGFLAMAMRGEGADTTNVWIMDFDRDFEPLKFLGLEKSDGDVAGADIPGFERFPGSKRAMTLSEFSDAATVHTLTYRGPGSVQAHVAHYERVLKSLGLEGPPPTWRGNDEGMLHYGSDTRQVSVFVSRAVSGNGILDVIQVRKGPEGDR